MLSWMDRCVPKGTILVWFNPKNYTKWREMDGPRMGNEIRHVSTALWKPWTSVSTGSPTGLDTSRRSFIRRDRQKAPRPLKYCSRIVTNTSREDKGIWKCSTPTCLGNCFRTRRSHSTNWAKPTENSTRSCALNSAVQEL
jgi:hypothetical protein